LKCLKIYKYKIASNLFLQLSILLPSLSDLWILNPIQTNIQRKIPRTYHCKYVIKRPNTSFDILTLQKDSYDNYLNDEINVPTVSLSRSYHHHSNDKRNGDREESAQASLREPSGNVSIVSMSHPMP
jgi:hypothetical protein